MFIGYLISLLPLLVTFFPQYLIILFLNMFGIMNWNKIHENIAASCRGWNEQSFMARGPNCRTPARCETEAEATREAPRRWQGSGNWGERKIWWVVEKWMEILFELLLLMVERFFVFVMLRRFSFLLGSITTWWYSLFISLSNCSASGIVSSKAASENASPQQTPGKCR